jgi:hypothetical protein
MKVWVWQGPKEETGYPWFKYEYPWRYEQVLCPGGPGPCQVERWWTGPHASGPMEERYA